MPAAHTRIPGYRSCFHFSCSVLLMSIARSSRWCLPCLAACHLWDRLTCFLVLAFSLVLPWLLWAPGEEPTDERSFCVSLSPYFQFFLSLCLSNQLVSVTKYLWLDLNLDHTYLIYIFKEPFFFSRVPVNENRATKAKHIYYKMSPVDHCHRENISCRYSRRKVRDFYFMFN